MNLKELILLGLDENCRINIVPYETTVSIIVVCGAQSPASGKGFHAESIILERDKIDTLDQRTVLDLIEKAKSMHARKFGGEG